MKDDTVEHHDDDADAEGEAILCKKSAQSEVVLAEKSERQTNVPLIGFKVAQFRIEIHFKVNAKRCIIPQHG